MWASWHNWGLAIDFTFVKANGRSESIRGIRPSARHWDRAGEIAESVGLYWGGRFRSGPDKPHLEWHPGFPNLIRYSLLQKLLRNSGSGAQHYQRVWRWFPSQR